MDIEVRLLRSFVAIFERGSLSRAAEKLACTQAAMSMRLKLLETELGEPLFLRQHHRLEPTFKGTEFYARALSVLAAYDEMISVTRSHRPRQKIRLGVPDDYALGILPRVLSQVDGGGIEIEVLCDLSANLATAVQRQELDIALVTLAARPLAAADAIEVDLRWVLHPNAGENLREAVPLAAYPEGCVFRRAMIAALEEQGHAWHVLAQSRNHAGIMSAVRGKLAVTAMARGTAPPGLTEVAENEFLPRLAPVPIYLLSNAKPADRPVQRIEALLRAALAEMAKGERISVSG